MNKAFLTKCAVIVAGLAMMASSVQAKPLLEIKMTTSKEVTEIRNGVKTVKMVPAKNVAPGDLLNYSISYKNSGDEVAINAKIDDPIPTGTAYIANSATGQGAEITFSSDSGKTFAEPIKLTYEYKSSTGKIEKRNVEPSNYTHIRWTVKSVPAGSSGTLGFNVIVK